MPIYHYKAVKGETGCHRCSNGFDLFRPMSRPPLECCPLCRTPVEKLISTVNSPRVTKPVSLSDAKKAGFTVLERRDHGVYEKR